MGKPNYTTANPHPVEGAQDVVLDTMINPIPRAIYLGKSGDVTGLLRDGNTTVTFKSMVAGYPIPIGFRMITSAGTTATDIVALY